MFFSFSFYPSFGDKTAIAIFTLRAYNTTRKAKAQDLNFKKTTEDNMNESAIANNNAPRFYSIRQAAKVGPLSEHVLRKLARQDKLPCIHSGKKVLINYDVLLSQLNDPDSPLLRERT